MVGSITNLITNFLRPVTPTRTKVSTQEPTSKNPFVNPFISTSVTSQSFYGKNKPIPGGYFAGYYNGKPNIVGSKLFIEV